MAHLATALVLLPLLLAACSPDDSAQSPRVRGAKPTREQVATSYASTTREGPPPITVSELVEGGRHVRLATSRGPVHVWTPKGYDRKRAETIVYVHGFYVHVDGAWAEYRLETQFAASALNAMFIAPEAPASGSEPVSWPSLADLLTSVERGLGEKLPRRRLVTIGHSGAWRTLLGWLSEPELDTVVLVDAAYGEIESYKNWVLGADSRRLIFIGDDTRRWTDELSASLPDTFVVDGFPSLEEGLPRDARRARIVYIKSELGHFPLVTNGIALPMILRTLRAKRLVKAPLSELMSRE